MSGLGSGSGMPDRENLLCVPQGDSPSARGRAAGQQVSPYSILNPFWVQFCSVMLLQWSHDAGISLTKSLLGKRQ